ncbi:MAG: iron ABC transporter permease [Phycisphaerales bacterium]
MADVPHAPPAANRPGPARPRRLPWVQLALLLALVLAVAVWLRLTIGGLGEGAERQMILDIRAQRVATAGIVGAALAVAGVLLQSLLRNPLASPDLLGLASGSGLGMMAAVYGAFLLTGRLADPGSLGAGGAAMAGACGTLGLVYAISQRRGFIEPFSLVLVGVIVGLMCGAGITLVQHLMPDGGFASGRLLVGALDENARWARIGVIGIITGLCCAIAWFMAPSMDRAALSDDEATSVGVHLGRLRTVQFLLAGLLTACAVLLAGPVGFIGLVAPHTVRMIAGARHGGLVLCAALCGAFMVVGADLLIAALHQARPGLGNVPLSVVTALVGGPVFVLVLRSQRGFVG